MLQANEASKEIRTELKTAKLALTVAKAAQKKFMAQVKQLAQFEKDWSKAAQPKRKPRRRKRTSTITEPKASTPEAPNVETPEPDQPESAPISTD